MPSAKLPLSGSGEEFCRKVCSFVRYKKAHRQIYEELHNHIEDHAEYLREQGIAPEEAERLAVQAMGDPEEIGRELDKQHRPLIERLLAITSVAKIIGILYGVWVSLYIAFIVLLTVGSLVGSMNYTVEKEDILYSEKLSQKQRVGAVTYKLQKITVTDDSSILVDYLYYGHNPDIILRGWTSPTLRVYDPEGNPYNSKGSSKAGFIHKSQVVVEGYDLSKGSIVLKAPSFYGDVEFRIPLREVQI
ncbi:MAG TPA: hypothetical protein GXX46_02375 [Peptococcaceae bacterium]|nr:hypothetical protein [Peptococcaceae bacterium]